MPTYVYHILDESGNPTGETVERFQSMKEDSYTIDPESNRPVRKAITLPNVVIDSKQPKTIGALAEKNTQEMIKKGDPRIAKKKKKKNPWWRDKKDKPLSTKGWSDNQKKKYIQEGKKPS